MPFDASAKALASSRFKLEQLYRLLDHLPSAAYVCDRDGLITYYNAQAEQYWGRTPRLNDPAERYCGSFKLHKADGSPMSHDQCWMARTLATGESFQGEEVVIERPDLRRFHALVYANPLFDDAGQLVGAVNIVVDICAQTEAQEAQARLAAIVESSDDAIVSKTLDGHILSWNSGAQRIFGYTADEVIGRSISILIPPEKLNEEHLILSKIAAGERVEHFETIRVTKNGERINISLTVSPIRDASGRIIAASKVAQDITSRTQATEAIVALKDALATQLIDLRRLQEMSVRLSMSLEMQPILEETLYTATSIEGTDRGLLLLVDPDRNDLTIGASLGFDAELLDTMSSAQFGASMGGKAQLEQRRVVIEDVETDPAFADDRDFARRAGFRAVHSTPLITRKGVLVGVLTIHFRHPHRPSDREMHLIDLCARQAVDCIENARLYSQLRDIDRRKDEFLATLAHELRNPLAPLSNSLHLLRLSEDLSPSAERVCEIMERQVNHMVRLIDDLLEVSRITRGKIELRTELLDLAGIIASAVETSRPLIDSFGHRLAIMLPTEPIMVQADGVRLSQVVANLLNNSAKYTDRGGQIWLNVRLEGDEAVISIRDNGLGIPTEMLSRVFEMFSQVDHTITRSQGGMGIGLTLARSFVQLHGGRIEASSNGPGEGSEFVVYLPLASAPQPSIDAGSSSSAIDATAQPSRRILVVDDAHAAEFVLGKLLEMLGHQVQTANDGAEALEIVRQQRPDIIISDIAMPNIDGYELARRLRRDPAFDRVVLVALTGYGQNSDKLAAREAGFDHHLTKPVSLEALQTLLASVPTAETSPAPLADQRLAPR